MNNCFVLLLLLACCGNNGFSGRDADCPSGRMSRGCSNNNFDNSCGREGRNDSCGCGREGRNNDSCMERGFGSFPSPGSTCGCEEKNV